MWIGKGTEGRRPQAPKQPLLRLRDSQKAPEPGAGPQIPRQIPRQNCCDGLTRPRPPGAPTPVTALPPALQNGFHTLAPASWVTPATPSPAGVRLVEPGSHDGTLAVRVAAGGRLASVGEEGRCKVTRGNSPDGGGGSRGTGLAMDWCAGALRSRGGGLCLVRGPAAQCQLSTAVKGTPRPATGAPTSSSFICPFAHSRGG